MAAEEPYDIRVKTYFPKVADFERDERGDPIFHTRKGPERIEARQQLARERLVAGAEVRESKGECGAKLTALSQCEGKMHVLRTTPICLCRSSCCTTS